MPEEYPSPWCSAAESGRGGPLGGCTVRKNTKTRSLENVDSCTIENRSA